MRNADVDAALAEFASAGRDAFLEKYGFGIARDYFVQDPRSGDWADSKAILGVAYGHRFPSQGPLRPSQCSGGIAHVVRILRELGYAVRSAGERHPMEENHRGWSRAEVELLVADYLSMLSLELAGQTYNKSQRRRSLQDLLSGRSAASIEFKRRNVSAVLMELGYPYIRGYLPAANKQTLLVEIVSRQISDDRSVNALAAAFTETPAVTPEVAAFEGLRVEAPPPSPRVRPAVHEEPSFRATKRDYLERESRNRSLGTAGEQFVVRYEQWRLAKAGLGRLADQVSHVSEERGDGLGFDVLSFQDDGTELFIEVKTTALSQLTPFYVSSTELRLSELEAPKFRLYRVFDFRSSPRFFELPGAISQHCHLDPASYRATLH